MSQYVLLAGAIIGVVALVAEGTATALAYVKGNQQSNPQDKTTLRVAGIFIGLSMLFLVCTYISAFIVLAAKQCRRTRIFLLIFATISAICLTIGIVIIRIYVKRKTDAGDLASARDLSAAWILPLVALPLFLISLILVYSVLGRRLRRLNRVCSRSQQSKGQQQQMGGGGMPALPFGA